MAPLAVGLVVALGIAAFLLLPRRLPKATVIRGRQVVGFLALAVGIWIAACQTAAMFAGGLAGVPIVLLWSAAMVAVFGLGEARVWQQAVSGSGSGLAIVASVAVGLSWLLFHNARNWAMVYAEGLVFQQCGYEDEYAFPGITLQQTFSIAESHNIDFKTAVPRLMRQSSSADVLGFTFVRFIRVAAWPPLTFLRTNGPIGVYGAFLSFGAVGGEGPNHQRLPAEPARSLQLANEGPAPPPPSDLAHAVDRSDPKRVTELLDKGTDPQDSSPSAGEEGRLGAERPVGNGKQALADRQAVEATLDLGNGVTLRLAQVPAGKFMMGSPQSEKDRQEEEVQHEVTISKPFFMAVYEITQQQYEHVVGKNPSDAKGARLPVVMVSWDDAVEFCKRVSARVGKTVRLPTEAEWEYACRAGTTTAFSVGDTVSAEQASLSDLCYVQVSGNWFQARGVDRNKAMPVGSFKPNAWGLYDMHGNVYEWCSDWYGKQYYAQSPAVDPPGPAKPQYYAEHVLRGGSFTRQSDACRSASRWFVNLPSPPNDQCGFRIVAELD